MQTRGEHANSANKRPIQNFLTIIYNFLLTLEVFMSLYNAAFYC